MQRKVIILSPEKEQELAQFSNQEDTYGRLIYDVYMANKTKLSDGKIYKIYNPYTRKENETTLRVNKKNYKKEDLLQDLEIFSKSDNFVGYNAQTYFSLEPGDRKKARVKYMGLANNIPDPKPLIETIKDIPVESDIKQKETIIGEPGSSLTATISETTEKDEIGSSLTLTPIKFNNGQIDIEDYVDSFSEDDLIENKFIQKIQEENNFIKKKLNDLENELKIARGYNDDLRRFSEISEEEKVDIGLPQIIDLINQPQNIDLTDQPQLNPDLLTANLPPQNITQIIDLTNQPQVIDLTNQPQVIDLTNQPQVIDLTNQPINTDLTDQPDLINMSNLLTADLPPQITNFQSGLIVDDDINIQQQVELNTPSTGLGAGVFSSTINNELEKNPIIGYPVSEQPTRSTSSGLGAGVFSSTIIDELENNPIVDYPISEQQPVQQPVQQQPIQNNPLAEQLGISNDDFIAGRAYDAIHKYAISIFFGSHLFPKWNPSLFETIAKDPMFRDIEKNKAFYYNKSKKIVDKYSVEILVDKLVYDMKASAVLIFKEHMEIIQLFVARNNPPSASSSDTVKMKVSDLIAMNDTLSYQTNNIPKQTPQQQTPQISQEELQRIVKKQKVEEEKKLRVGQPRPPATTGMFRKDKMVIRNALAPADTSMLKPGVTHIYSRDMGINGLYQVSDTKNLRNFQRALNTTNFKPFDAIRIKDNDLNTNFTIKNKEC